MSHTTGSPSYTASRTSGTWVSTGVEIVTVLDSVPDAWAIVPLTVNVTEPPAGMSTGVLMLPAPELGQLASEAAADPAVRRAMVARQRSLMASGDWVAEGRDIGTVVAPEAELKVFLTADPRERAERRALQTGQDVESVLAEQDARDARDRGREASPLTAAPDAVMVDTSGVTLQDVVDRIAGLVDDRLSAAGTWGAA